MSILIIAISYPVTSRLGDIFTNLLGRQTERTDLGGQSRLGSDFTTGHPQVAARKVVSIASESARRQLREIGMHTYMIFTSLGSNFGATQEVKC